jgi:hypothetical protein
MANFINPFDFQKIFIDLFAGSTNLFTFLAVIIISMALGFFRVPDKIYFPMIALFAVMFAATIGSAMYALVILIAGIVTFKLIAKVVT